MRAGSDALSALSKGDSVYLKWKTYNAKGHCLENMYNDARCVRTETSFKLSCKSKRGTPEWLSLLLPAISEGEECWVQFETELEGVKLLWLQIDRVQLHEGKEQFQPN